MTNAKKSVYSLIEDARKTLENLGRDDVYQDLYLGEDFSCLNAYIANKASLDKRSLYIGTSDKQSAQELTMPILYPEVCRLLLENASLYVASTNPINIGRTFIVDGVLMNYGLKDSRHILFTRIKQGKRIKFFESLEQIVISYYMADERYYFEGKCNQNLGHYQAFYQAVSRSKNIAPSIFKKKIIVISRKKEFFDELKRLGLLHALPVAGITRNHQEPTNSTLPIDPMILVASEYELVREYMLRNHETQKFEYLLFTGDSKISRLKALVKNDCANGLFSRFCLVGNQAVVRDNSMLLWHWNSREENNLSGRHSLEFVPDPLDMSDELMDASKNFYTLLSQVQEELGAPELSSKLRYAFYKILFDKLDTITDFDTQIAEPLMEETEKAMRADNYEPEEFTKELEDLILSLKQVYLAKQDSSTLIDRLKEQTTGFTTLVVSNKQVEDWQKRILVSTRFFGKVLPFKTFKQELANGLAYGTYLLAMLPNYKQIAWLNNISMFAETKIHLALYKPELKRFQTQLRQIRKYESRNMGPKDTSLFPHLSLNNDEREAAEDIISRFEENYSETTAEDGFAFSGARAYTSCSLDLLDSAGNRITETSPNKVLRVLSEDAELMIDNDFELVSVQDLEEGDKILLYCNRSRDSLYNILSQESERFSQMNESSKLWKTKIREYLYIQVFEDSPFYQIDTQRLQKLSINAGLDPESIRSRWVLHPDAIRFPQKSKMDRVLEFLKNEGFLTQVEVDEIRCARSFFMGVMISLGQNLSNELQSIMLNKEGNPDIYITRHVLDNQSEYPLLSHFDEMAILSILKHNYEGYRFIQIGETEVDNDGE
jgi:hypothetical protein